MAFSRGNARSIDLSLVRYFVRLGDGVGVGSAWDGSGLPSGLGCSTVSTGWSGCAGSAGRAGRDQRRKLPAVGTGTVPRRTP